MYAKIEAQSRSARRPPTTRPYVSVLQALSSDRTVAHPRRSGRAALCTTVHRSTPAGPAVRRTVWCPAMSAGASRPGRGGHVVDLALLFAELARAPGVTQADLARRYRKSAGYVSVVCRLGHALRALPPEARDRLRVPHFTLKAAQALVSRHPEPAALRTAAVRLAAAPPPARVRSRVGVPSAWDRAPARGDGLDPLPEAPDAISQRGAFVYAWDAEAARHDPAAVLADFEAFVRETTDEVIRRLRRESGDFGSAPAQPGRGVGGRATSAVPAGYGELSLRQLHERVRATLRGHRARMDEFLAERERARGRGAAWAQSANEGPPPAEADAGEVEPDLD